MSISYYPIDLKDEQMSFTISHTRFRFKPARARRWMGHVPDSNGLVIVMYNIVKGSLDEKLPSYEVLKMLRE